ncbi:M28 family peptidase [Candidatus Latescibacterota bacterium]
MGRTYFLTYAIMLALAPGVLSCDHDVVPAFDSDRAFSNLERQVAFGPRVPGTSEHMATRDWLVEQLRTCTSNVALQPFRDTFAGSDEDMYNILASFYPDKKERILLCAHWDCRPHADRDPDPSHHTDPVPGANDSASGVAVLLEIARTLRDNEPPVGVDIVFFDGEDGGEYGNNDTWLLGSRHFARTMPSSFRPRYAILLDMIGDSDLMLSRDYHSMESAPLLWARIEEAADLTGVAISPTTSGIIDDHLPLIERGIPSVDLIDFDYESWHTIADTPDKCSAESLGKIGELVLRIIYGD